MKTKITTVPERFQPKLREHNFTHAQTWKEKIEVLGRDEKGRIKPLVPKPQIQDNSDSHGAIPEGPVR